MRCGGAGACALDSARGRSAAAPRAASPPRIARRWRPTPSGFLMTGSSVTSGSAAPPGQQAERVVSLDGRDVGRAEAALAQHPHVLLAGPEGKVRAEEHLGD